MRNNIANTTTSPDVSGALLTAPTTKRLVEPSAEAMMLPERRVQTWRQRLAILALVFSDIIFGLLFWGLAYLAYTLFHQMTWGGELHPGFPIEFTLPNLVAWIGLRALLSLYPGYGLSQAEELRRQTLSTVAVFALTLVFILDTSSFAGERLFLILLACLDFLERLLLAPLGRHLMKWGTAKIGLLGKPVIILGAGEPGKQLLQVLQREWGLGYKPAAVFDFRLPPKLGRHEDVPYGGTVIDALDLA